VRRLSGRGRSALIIGIQGIRARKLRTLLSMISLFMGVLAVVVVQGAAETAERALLTDLELTQGYDGTTLLHTPVGRGSVSIVMSALTGRSGAVAAMESRAIIGEPGVRPVNPGGSPFPDDGQPPPDWYGTPIGPNGVPLYCDPRGCYEIPVAEPEPAGAAIELRLVVLTGDIRQFRPYRTESGQWLDFTSEPSYAPRIVINKEAAKGFARHRVPAEMRLDGATANATPRIIGVVDDAGGQPTAYVRADELVNWVSAAALDNGTIFEITVMLTPDSLDLARMLTSQLAGAGFPAEAIATERVDARKRLGKQLAIVRWVFLGLAGVVLLIGVAGILNVGLATVGERVEEFALRRAVGTSRLLLAGIVLAETLLTGLLTAAAAIGVAAAAVPLAAQLLGDRDPLLRDLTFPWEAGVAGVIAGLVAGVLGGLIPAIRAARIPIATVMRA
jgi:putative ABC transport system permease protein